MNGAVYITRFDQNKGFHQLKLDEESREITTFITHQRRNLVDYIMIWGKTKEEHDEFFEKLSTRLSENEITVSKNNFELGFKEFVFFGFKLSKDGITPTEDKEAGLRDAGTPVNKKVLGSFLGLAVFLSTYIPNLAILTGPL